MAKTNYSEKLRKGDYSIIAEMVGKSLSYVWEQLNDSDRPLTNEVEKATVKLIRSREKLLKK